MSQLPLLVTVPHASAELPVSLFRFRDCPTWARVNRTHFALDRGAADLAAAVAVLLDVHVVVGTCSRLAVDLNRALNDPNVFPATAGEVRIPFNSRIDPADMAARRRVHRRFHEQVSIGLQTIAKGGASNRAFLLDLHTFTRSGLTELPRTVDIGVCVPQASPFAEHLLKGLVQGAELAGRETPWHRPLNIRLDEPYAGSHPGIFLSRRHADARTDCAVVEVCDDLLETKKGVMVIADLLANALRKSVLLGGA